MIRNNSGIHYVFYGFRLIREAGLRRYVWVPLICNIVVFASLLAYTIHLIHASIRWTEHLLPSWLAWLSWLFWPLFLIAFFLLIYYLFVFIANLIATPFNALLSEKTQLFLTHQPLASQSIWKIIIKETPRSLKRQFSWLGYYIPRALFFIILFFIPLIQTIAPLLWFLFNAWMMTVQYVDYPMDNNRISFKEMRRILRGKQVLNYSFGGAVAIATMIPILNFFVMPAAVVGATAMWIDHYKD